jgi:hypothetical protein
VLSCEARQRRVLDMLSKIVMSASISGNDKPMVNISSILVCFVCINNRTHLYWLVYLIELETKGMTDIVMHALYPDLHLEI